MMLSVQVMSCVCLGVGMFEMYMLKSIDERMTLYRTLVLNWHCVDVVFLKVV